MESKRFVGKWWRPDSADRVVGGVLEVEKSGAGRLELTDELLGGDPAPVVHGVSNGRPITLFDCSPDNGGKTTFGQYYSVVEIVRPASVLVGVHLDSETESRFRSLRISISHLTTWAPMTGLRHSTDLVPRDPADPEGSLRHKASHLEMTTIESLGARVDTEKEVIELGWTLMVSPARDTEWVRTFQAAETAHITITSDNMRPWGGFNDSAAAMRDLMTLAVQTACFVEDRTLLIEREDTQRPLEVSVYFDPGISGGQPLVKRRDIAFRLPDVQFSEVIPRWFELRKKIGLPLDVLFGLDYSKGSYYENELFNVASAAEGFHAALRPESTGINEQLHQQIKAKVAATFTGEEKAWVRSRTGDNRPGLKQRLLELSGIPDGTAVEDLVGNADLWAKWLRNVRNAVGHLDMDGLNNSVPEDARYRLTYITKALLHLVLLNELGIGSTLQRRLVTDSFGYSARAFRREIETALNPQR